MSKFYYQIEAHRGYIPSDKIHKNGQPFETGWHDRIVGQDITDEWQAIRHEHPMDKAKLSALFAKIDANIIKFLLTHEQEDPKKKAFYLNFNADGIDCFTSRWNWKPLD